MRVGRRLLAAQDVEGNANSAGEGGDQDPAPFHDYELRIVPEGIPGYVGNREGSDDEPGDEEGVQHGASLRGYGWTAGRLKVEGRRRSQRAYPSSSTEIAPRTGWIGWK